MALPSMTAAMFVMDRQQSRSSEEAHHAHSDELTKRQAYYLFMSHTLCMWNSRMFEFGVVRAHCFFKAR